MFWIIQVLQGWSSLWWNWTVNFDGGLRGDVCAELVPECGQLVQTPLLTGQGDSWKKGTFLNHQRVQCWAVKPWPGLFLLCRGLPSVSPHPPFVCRADSPKAHVCSYILNSCVSPAFLPLLRQASDGCLASEAIPFSFLKLFWQRYWKTKFMTRQKRKGEGNCRLETSQGPWELSCRHLTISPPWHTTGAQQTFDIRCSLELCFFFGIYICILSFRSEVFYFLEQGFPNHLEIESLKILY